MPFPREGWHRINAMLCVQARLKEQQEAEARAKQEAQAKAEQEAAAAAAKQKQALAAKPPPKAPAAKLAAPKPAAAKAVPAVSLPEKKATPPVPKVDAAEAAKRREEGEDSDRMMLCPLNADCAYIAAPLRTVQFMCSALPDETAEA